MESVCDWCIAAFSSQFTLHKHIRTRSILLHEAIAEMDSSSFPARPILESTAKFSALSSDLSFNSWNYVTISINFDLTVLPSLIDLDSLVCLHTTCEVILVNRNWLAKKLSSQKISTMPVFVKVGGIDASKHESRNIVLTTIYISGIDKKSHEIYRSISYELHRVDGLKVNMLVGNDVLCTEDFAIYLSILFTLIHSCDVKIDINARQYSKFLRHKALASTSTIVSLYSEAVVALQYIKLSDSRDFLFSPSLL